MKTILKPMLAMGVVVVSLLITAFSCDKNSGNGNSEDFKFLFNNGNSDGGPSGLALTVGEDASSFVKIKDNTVYISAARLASKLTPLSKATDAGRSFHDLRVADNESGSSTSYLATPFNILYNGSEAGMTFVSRTHVNKDTMALRANSACSSTISGEYSDNVQAKAAKGGLCKFYTTNLIFFPSELGTVFDNTKTTSRARGKLQCLSALGNYSSASKNFLRIYESTRFNSINGAICYIGVVNNGLGTRVEIDDAWATDTSSTTEVELYALAVDVTDKRISEFSSVSGFDSGEFAKELDNAAFKKILEKNQWHDLRFKVKIVRASEFTSL